METRYCVGIDLGTSNSALALARADGEEGAAICRIPQLFSLQAVGELEILPSVLYLPLENEAAGVTASLPWQADAGAAGIVGQLAREQGALRPERMVASAKSWLCNPHVDPEAATLPWKAELEPGQKVSPFGASVRYLAHLRAACRSALERRGEHALEAAEVVVTVPASFDDVARALTHRAAQAAGWGEVTLLEEQQAAFYYWISQSGGKWREHVHPGDLVLVCDVGGGTADFSLVAVSEQAGALQLERVSVGDHILLGGDNMDLALAYAVRGELEKGGAKLDNWQFLSLIHSCRVGKEALFADTSLPAYPISVPSRGASLFAGTLSASLNRDTLNSVLLDGFFPRTAIDEHPARRRNLGLKEFGLDYAADPALSKHLAFFLARSFRNTQGSESLSRLVASRLREKDGVPFIFPSAILFNGGVFKAAPLRQRIMEILSGWDRSPVAELPESDFDLAVAKGAAVYARTRLTGEGIRIKAGTARSYYIGLESSMPAVPGMTPPLKAVCVVPQGMEEGSEESLPGQDFGLVTGELVEFRFFSSTVRAGDRVGDLVESEEDLEETASLQLTLPPLEGGEGAMIPVRLHSVVTELGTLELWLRHEPSGRQWKLEFNVRGD